MSSRGGRISQNRPATSAIGYTVYRMKSVDGSTTFQNFGYSLLQLSCLKSNFRREKCATKFKKSPFLQWKVCWKIQSRLKTVPHRKNFSVEGLGTVSQRHYCIWLRGRIPEYDIGIRDGSVKKLPCTVIPKSATFQKLFKFCKACTTRNQLLHRSVDGLF